MLYSLQRIRRVVMSILDMISIPVAMVQTIRIDEFCRVCGKVVVSFSSFSLLVLQVYNHSTFALTQQRLKGYIFSTSNRVSIKQLSQDGSYLGLFELGPIFFQFCPRVYTKNWYQHK